MGNALRYFRMENNENTNGNGERVANKDKVFKPLKKYFEVTGQYFSLEHSSKAKQALYRLWQFAIFCLASLFFIYTLGIWGVRKKEYDIACYFFYYPITTIEWIVWEFRWLVTCCLGIVLTKGIWLKLFDKNISLEDTGWKKVKHFSWAMVGALLSMWAFTVLGTMSEIDFQITPGLAFAICADALFTLIGRAIAFPLFFLFCVTMYTLCCMVEEYRDKIEKWPTETEGDNQGENSARERFREIKEAIRVAGLSFEFYVMVHFLLLVCTFFLGVCACFERHEVKIGQNYTVTAPFQIPHYARYINVINVGNFTPETGVTGTSAQQSASFLTASHPQMTESQGEAAATGANNTMKTDPVDHFLKIRWLRHNLKNNFVCSFIKTLESLLLYFIPVSLMLRLENRLRRVYEVVEDSNVETQRNRGFLFENVEVIRRMCKYVKTAHGLKIFGYTVPTFESFILAAFGSFIVAIVQGLLTHVHMEG